VLNIEDAKILRVTGVVAGNGNIDNGSWPAVEDCYHQELVDCLARSHLAFTWQLLAAGCNSDSQ